MTTLNRKVLKKQYKIYTTPRNKDELKICKKKIVYYNFIEPWCIALLNGCYDELKYIYDDAKYDDAKYDDAKYINCRWVNEFRIYYYTAIKEFKSNMITIYNLKRAHVLYGSDNKILYYFNIARLEYSCGLLKEVIDYYNTQDLARRILNL